MTTRALHRLIGIIMVLPLVAWAITGAIFFIKPGYAPAYETLAVKTYPVASPVTFPANTTWLEVRYLKTVIGEHLLVRTAAGWQHLDARSLLPKPEPNESELRALVDDACASNPARYGRVIAADRTGATTDTGVHISVNWSRLALSQRGRDTDRIDLLYKIHYLQWTGNAWADRTLGIAGIALMLILSGLGVWLFVKTR